MAAVTDGRKSLTAIRRYTVHSTQSKNKRDKGAVPAFRYGWWLKEASRN